MWGKTVKINDVGLLQFLYPTAVIREELSFTDRDNDVIYVGKIRPKLKEYLTINTKRFINTVGIPDEDLTKPQSLVEFIYSLKDRKPPNTVLEQSKVLDMDYLEYLCKVYYISGHWVSKKDNVEETMYSLFQASVGTVKDLLKTYFLLREIYPYEVIQSSFVTFLSRVITIEEQSVSQGYMMLLKQANQRYGQKIRPLVYRLGNEGGKESDFIRFLLDLK